MLYDFNDKPITPSILQETMKISARLAREYARVFERQFGPGPVMLYDERGNVIAWKPKIGGTISIRKPVRWCA